MGEHWEFDCPHCNMTIDSRDYPTMHAYDIATLVHLRLHRERGERE